MAPRPRAPPPRPPPSDLIDSLSPPRSRGAAGARARADTPRHPPRGEAFSTAVTIACALLLGGLFGLSVGQALRHRAPQRPPLHASPSR